MRRSGDERGAVAMDAEAGDAGTGDAAAGGRLLPGYTHGRVLGTGASGRVVLARHDATGTPVAIKYLNRGTGAENLRAEAEVLAGLRSPHVTRLYEYVESGHGCAIVMELVDGVALRTLLREEGATTPRAALVVLKGSLLGLAAAHAAGVVHRDYKPGNVLVAADGTSKLVDFGIAVRSGDDRDISGTPAYLAPEQWAGKPAAPAADVYSATVTFFECLTGARPFDGATVAELAVQHTEAPIPDELAPAEVRPLIRAGLAKTPAARPGSAAAFVAELEAVAAAGYGPDWESRGYAELALMVTALAALLPWGAGGPADGGTALAHTSLARSSVPPSADAAPARQGLRRPRIGRRAKILAGAAAGVLAAGSLAGVAVAGAGERDARTVLAAPAPEATTTLGPAAAPPVPSSPAPTAVETTSVSASPSASAVPSPAVPTATATGTVRPPSTSPTASTKASPPAAPTPAPTSTASATATVTPTASTSPAPTTAAPVVTPRVTFLNLDGFRCGGRYDTVATVTVQTDGAADVTLTLSWIHKTVRTVGNPVAATQTVVIPKGSTTVRADYPHAFGANDANPIWAVQVTTGPAAERSRVTYAQLDASTCNPPR